MKRVLLIDPYVGGFNLGDLIIREAVLRELKMLCQNVQIMMASIHQPFTRMHRKRMRCFDLVVVAGSSMLTGRHWLIGRVNRWPLSMQDVPYLKDKVVLFGVGWENPSVKTSIFRKVIWRTILHKEIIHSLRDSYTTKRFKEDFNLTNAINTSCPTLWELNVDKINWKKGKRVVTTLTDYSKDSDADKRMLLLLKKVYKEVFFWPQGLFDLDYLKSLRIDGITIVPTNLESFDLLLSENDDIDYVGTRLHAGIRALQHGRRAIFISVDHRTPNICRDVGLPVAVRYEFQTLEELIYSENIYEINLPYHEIMLWRDSLKKVLCER